MHASDITQETIDRANELYWSSSKSVNQIAETLELSKGALYGAIEPEPAGLGCPLCGDEVAYPNRTAKEREVLDCPTCDWDGSPDETIELSRDEPRESAPTDSTVEGEEATPPPPTSLTGPSSRTVLGGALLGAAAGLALVMWARRR